MAVGTTTITAGWTPPPAITGFSGTVDEEHSKIVLAWTASSLSDTDFSTYAIFRREQGDLDWEQIASIADKTVVEYEDYTAGQTLVYNYMILQYKNIVGDVPLASDDSEIVTAGLTGDVWFLARKYGATYEPIELFVTQEDHTAVIQQEVFEPLAGERKRVVRGLALGDEGQLTSLFDVAVARDRKVFFEVLKITPGPHVLKSAFGDVWFVEFDAPAFKYRTGGHLEVTVGWVEV